MNKNINLLRFNCLLANRTLSGFKNVVLSFLSEYLIDQSNVEQNIKECYRYVTDQKSIEITYDVFNVYIGESKSFSVRRDKTEIYVKLTNSRYSEILKKIDEESLEAHLNKFIAERSLSSDVAESIKQILYQSIYLNIMSFDIKNVKSIMSIDIEKNFGEEEIKLFNEFLDQDSSQKNDALYHVFLNAVEFAIISSGRGVREYVKHIFKEKTYHLDTNIIIRLLGVGGEERKKGLEKLFHICSKQGVSFKISRFTHKEINAIIDAKISLLNSQITVQGLAESVGGFVAENKNIGFNNDFITHYSKTMVNESTVTDLESYRFFLKKEIKKLKKEFDIKVDYRIKVDDDIVKKFAEVLFQEKRKIRRNITYSKTAAIVDSANIINVRNLRRGNNYNFQDIKDFYLTTDGILNKILQDENDLLSETILPSQLFMLHNGLFAEDDEIDFDLFVSFLKKRTTEFQLSGKDILLYIDNIRKHTTHPEDAKEIIELFLEERYESGRNNNISEEDEIRVLEQVTTSYLQERIEEQGEEVQKLRSIFENACNKFASFFTKARILSYLIELILLLILGGISILSGSMHLSLIVTLVLFSGLELTRYFASDRFNFVKRLQKSIFLRFVKRSDYYQLSNKDVYYLHKAEEYFESKT